MVRTFLIFVLFFLYSSSIDYNNDDSAIKESTIILTSDSFLKIKGKTNLSTFECQFNMTAVSKPISIKYKDFESKIEFEEANLILPNIEFDCGGEAINKDFKALLNTDDYPMITFKLKKLSKVETKSNSRIATIELNINDIVKTYKISVFFEESNVLNVSGVMPLNITDFNLVAPTKVLGMVKVSPKIEIHFALKII